MSRDRLVLGHNEYTKRSRPTASRIDGEVAMKSRARVLALSAATSTLMLQHVSTASAEPPTITPVMTKDLMDAPGREVVMMTVEYGPGGSDPIHRHQAQGLIYVIEGSVEMQVKGGKLVTLTPGQTFYEGPNDLHVVGRNASSTKPAKFIVVLIKDQGTPLLVPE
jgi:quercetin dioxygenase-like cupin family protein